MRIIGGKFSGRTLSAPASIPARPTTDFAKSGLFNILHNHFDFTQLHVLDLFGGIGSISFEFVSRNAKSVTYVDENFQCAKFVKETKAKLEIDSLECVRYDAFKFLKQCSRKFDIIFADPPFEFEKTDTLPDLIFEKKIVRKNGWLIIEHQAKRVLQTTIPVDEIRKYGNCAFSIFRNTEQIQAM